MCLAHMQPIYEVNDIICSIDLFYCSYSLSGSVAMLFGPYAAHIWSK